MRRPDREPTRRQPLRIHVPERPRKPKIHHTRPSLGKNDVLRLDVPMHDAVVVRILEPLRDLLRNLDRIFD